MSVKVHYEDNLFFLHSILRTLESGLRLDIDPEYFKDKILEDIFFIDASLMRTFSALKDNGYLINRAAYLRSLRRTVRAFADFLLRLNAGELGVSDIFNAHQDRLASTLSAHQRVMREIDAMLDQLAPDEEASDVVSSQEYDFLLAGEAEDPDSEG
ncbi:MAG: hypothetical protein PF508_20500 [Spirochaeta sp.]|jgi:hypothetical protein|nr:hypothetical protein [Spirochaeta sp.]